jgi:hypothetical protein
MRLLSNTGLRFNSGRALARERSAFALTKPLR